MPGSAAAAREATGTLEMDDPLVSGAVSALVLRSNILTLNIKWFCRSCKVSGVQLSINANTVTFLGSRN